MGNKKIKNFVIQNQIDELSYLAEKIDELAEQWNLSAALAMNLNLVIEEAVSNVIFYAFSDKNKHEIGVTFSLENDNIVIKITDDGIPFNPLEQQKPDIDLPAEERPVGGLGIFLMTQIMDEITYSRKENKNNLTLKKGV